MYDEVMVPVDGSKPAMAAVHRTLSLAETDSTTVSLLAVVEPAILPMAEELPANPTRTALDEQTTEALEKAEALAADAGVDCQTVIESGTPHEEITTRVEDEGLDLIAMGTHGRTGLDRLLHGSVTERTLRTSDVPVVTTHDREVSWSLDDLLVPTDGSAPATDAAAHAIDLAAAIDATVHVLSVVDTQQIADTYDAGAVVPAMIEPMIEDARSDAEVVHDMAVERGLDAETAVIQGVPGRAIPEYAGETDTDLVVMGTHGRSGLERYLLGSVAERTVRTSPVPVLAVPS